jgi:hypothetical protein
MDQRFHKIHKADYNKKQRSQKLDFLDGTPFKSHGLGI